MFVTIQFARPGTRLPRPLTSPKTRRFKFSRPNISICLSPFAATHARNARVNPFPATHTKMARRKSFTCHTYEKAGVSPQGFVAIRMAFSFGNCSVGSVAQEDRVRFDVPALDGQFGPVWRKPKPHDSFLSEMRELPRGRAIERLLPKIIHALFSHHVYNRFRVWREGQGR